MSAAPERRAVLVAAAIVEVDGRLLVTRRPAGTHLAGCWEFPGGKCREGESLPSCLRRELREELAVEADVQREVFATRHDYPDRSVELRFFRCELRGSPTPQLGQDMRWVARADLATMRFPPADRELVLALAQRRATGAREDG